MYHLTFLQGYSSGLIIDEGPDSNEMAEAKEPEKGRAAGGLRIDVEGIEDDDCQEMGTADVVRKVVGRVKVCWIDSKAPGDATDVSFTV